MSIIRNETFIGGNMSNIMDDIRSGRGLPPLGDSVPMPDVKQPKNKIDFRVYYTLDELLLFPSQFPFCISSLQF